MLILQQYVLTKDTTKKLLSIYFGKIQKEFQLNNLLILPSPSNVKSDKLYLSQLDNFLISNIVFKD